MANQPVIVKSPNVRRIERDIADRPPNLHVAARSCPAPASRRQVGRGMTELPGQPEDEVVELATRLFGYAEPAPPSPSPTTHGRHPTQPDQRDRRHPDHARRLPRPRRNSSSPARRGRRPQPPQRPRPNPTGRCGVQGRNRGGPGTGRRRRRPHIRQPSAVDTARMFGQTELLALFEQNPPSPDRRSGRPKADRSAATDS